MNANSLKPNHRILLVDDNMEIHKDFRKILCPDTNSATVVGNLEAALFDDVKPAVHETRFELDSAYQGQEALAMVQKALPRFLTESLSHFLPPKLPAKVLAWACPLSLALFGNTMGGWR